MPSLTKLKPVVQGLYRAKQYDVMRVPFANLFFRNFLLLLIGLIVLVFGAGEFCREEKVFENHFLCKNILLRE